MWVYRVKQHLKSSPKEGNQIHPKRLQLACIYQHFVHTDADHKALQAPFWCLNYDRRSAMPRLKEWTLAAFISFRHKPPLTPIQPATDTTHRLLQSPAKVCITDINIWCNTFALSKTVTGRPKLKTLKISYYFSRRFPSENGRKITWTATERCLQSAPRSPSKSFLFFRIKETVFASRWFWNHLHNSWYRSQTDLNSATRKSKWLLKTISRINKSAPGHDHTFPSQLLERC